MKTYILKLKTTSTTNYNLYDGTTLVSDSDLATLFGSAGSAYFTFDFNEGTPTNTTSLTILNSQDTAVMTNTGLEGIAEDRNFKGVWADSATAFTSFTLLKGVAMDEAELTTLVGMAKEGKIKTLTRADYNWSVSGNPPYTAVDVKALGVGIYKTGQDSLAVRVSGENFTFNSNAIIVQSQSGVLYERGGYWAASDSGSLRWFAHIQDNLTSTDSASPLSAKQGKVLKDLIDSIAIRGAGAPTTSTVGTVGRLYEDTTNGDLYQLKFIDTTVTPNTYDWEKVGGGSANNIFQVTGYYDDSTSSWKVRESVADIEAAISSQTPIALVNEQYQDNGRDEIDFVYKSFVSTSEISLFGARVASPSNDTSSSGAGTLGLYSRTFTINRTTGALATNNDQKLIPTVVQTTGTSTTDVMSQNAVSRLIYADPTYPFSNIEIKSKLNNQKSIVVKSDASVSDFGIVLGYGGQASGNSAIAIGGGGDSSSITSASGNRSVAIGQKSVASSSGAVALGAFSSASAQGEVNIGSTDTSYGYNSSNYRLLTGLYDPQSAHDAATKGYVDGTTETLTIATSGWATLASSDPYDYSATVTAATTIGANSLVELINDQAVLFATHGFAIGAISGQSVTIYSVGQPSASVSLKINVKG